MKWMRSKVPSHFGGSREVVVVEVDMGVACVLCHFYLEATQLGLHQVLKGYHFQKRLSKILRNVLLPAQGFLSLTTWLHTIIKSLH